MGRVKPSSELPDTAAPLTIGRAAVAAGVTPKAVRLYETRGLLNRPARTAAGYRLYNNDHVARLRFIAAARHLGLRLDQVAEILAAAHDGQRPCGTTRALLDQRLNEINSVISELAALRAALTAARDGHSTTVGDATVCPVIESPSLNGGSHPGNPTPATTPHQAGFGQTLADAPPSQMDPSPDHLTAAWNAAVSPKRDDLPTC
jgi:MerR family copper efflux transcriptional regulator